MAQIYKDQTGRDVYQNNGQIIDAKTGQVVSGGIPSQTTTAQNASTMPQAGSPLLNFAGVLDKAVNLARQKRNQSSLNIMMPNQGTAMASDFNSILSGLNRASDTTASDLTKRALEADTTKFDTLKDDSGNLWQVEMDNRGKIIGKPELLFKGEPKTTSSGGYSDQEERRLREAGIDPTNISASDRYLYGDNIIAGDSKQITPDKLVSLAGALASSVVDKDLAKSKPDEYFADIDELISTLQSGKTVEIDGKQVELKDSQLNVLVSELEAIKAKGNKWANPWPF